MLISCCRPRRMRGSRSGRSWPWAVSSTMDQASTPAAARVVNPAFHHGKMSGPCNIFTNQYHVTSSWKITDLELLVFSVVSLLSNVLQGIQHRADSSKGNAIEHVFPLRMWVKTKVRNIYIWVQIYCNQQEEGRLTGSRECAAWTSEETWSTLVAHTSQNTPTPALWHIDKHCYHLLRCTLLELHVQNTKVPFMFLWFESRGFLTEVEWLLDVSREITRRQQCMNIRATLGS